MQLIAHQSQLDHLPPSAIGRHVAARFHQLSEDTDQPPTIILVEPSDDLSGPSYSFLGDHGIYTSIYGTSVLSDETNISIFDWISFLPELGLYQLMYIEGDLGYWLFCPAGIVEAVPDLKLMISSQELSDPQPLF